MISYVLSDETNKSFSIEHTLMATAMRSLVERCISYVNKIKDDDINPEHEKLSIISDHAVFIICFIFKFKKFFCHYHVFSFVLRIEGAVSTF